MPRTEIAPVEIPPIRFRADLEHLSFREMETVFRENFLRVAKVTDFEKGYVSVPFINQVILPEYLLIGARLIIEYYRRQGVLFDRVVGIPNSGVPLAVVVATELFVPYNPGQKAPVPPGSWQSVVEVEEMVPSFTTGTRSKMRFNRLDQGESVLVVDDFMATGYTASLVTKALQNRGIDVQVAAHADKLFQGGSQKVFQECGIEPFSVVAIEQIFPDGRIQLAPPHFSPE